MGLCLKHQQIKNTLALEYLKKRKLIVQKSGLKEAVFVFLITYLYN